MISTQREKRFRRPRNVFSPSDNFNRSTHYLLYFDTTDSYSIALSSSVNNITGDTATLNIRGKKTLATIITTGTLETCENEQKKRTRESQQSSYDDQDEESDDDSNEGIDISPFSENTGTVTTFPLTKRQRTALTTNSASSVSGHDNRNLIAPNNGSDEDEIYSPLNRAVGSINPSGINTKSTISKRKRTQTRAPSKTSKRQRNNNLNNHDKDNEQVDVFAGPGIISVDNTKDILRQIENTFVVFQNNITRSFQKIEKKIDCHIGPSLAKNSKFFDQYRTEQDGVIQTEYIENGINLLATLAKDPIDFSRKTLKLLFSQKELKTQLLPPKREHLRREPLDERRFNKLLDAVRIKFRIDPNRMQEFYNDVLKTKLANFLYEERRRDKRRRVRDHERVLKKTIFPLNEYDHQQNFDDDEGEETTS